MSQENEFLSRNRPPGTDENRYEIPVDTNNAHGTVSTDREGLRDSHRLTPSSNGDIGDKEESEDIAAAKNGTCSSGSSSAGDTKGASPVTKRNSSSSREYCLEGQHGADGDSSTESSQGEGQIDTHSYTNISDLGENLYSYVRQTDIRGQTGHSEEGSVNLEVADFTRNDVKQVYQGLRRGFRFTRKQIGVAMCIVFLAMMSLAMFGLYKSTLKEKTVSPGPQVMLSVTRPDVDVYSSSWQKVLFGKTSIDHGGIYIDSNLTTPSEDIYLLSMMTYAESDVKYSVKGTGHSVGISRLSAARTDIFQIAVLKTYSRSILLKVPGQATLYMEYMGRLGCCLWTTWSMFSLSAALDPFMAFSVSRKTPQSTLGKIGYDRVLLNIGLGYNMVEMAFLAPKTGLYFLSTSVGVKKRQDFEFQLMKNGDTIMSIVCTGTPYDDTEIVSSAVIVSLSRGDRVHTELVRGAVHRSPGFTEATLGGFLYEPAHGRKVAWSVWQSSYRPTSSFHEGRVPYDEVYVNEGHAYDVKRHLVSVPVSGTYFLHLAAGASTGEFLNLVLMVGTSPEIGGRSMGGLQRYSANTPGLDHTSSDILLPLTAGENIWIQADIGINSNLYSNQKHVTGFSGFLLCPA